MEKKEDTTKGVKRQPDTSLEDLEALLDEEEEEDMEESEPEEEDMEEKHIDDHVPSLSTYSTEDISKLSSLVDSQHQQCTTSTSTSTTSGSSQQALDKVLQHPIGIMLKTISTVLNRISQIIEDTKSKEPRSLSQIYSQTLSSMQFEVLTLWRHLHSNMERGSSARTQQQISSEWQTHGETSKDSKETTTSSQETPEKQQSRVIQNGNKYLRLDKQLLTPSPQRVKAKNK